MDDRGTFRQYLLPLSLQDVCLVMVINDLDSYPVELLASLPRWLRYRLLDNLPALDLCRLDHTPIAVGVDVEEIWSSKAVLPRLPFNLSYTSEPPFSDYISDANKLYYHILETSDEDSPVATLQGQSVAYKDEPQSREEFFCNVLSNVFEYEIRAAVDLLISIRGDLFKKLTTTETVHQSFRIRHNQDSVHPFSRFPVSTISQPRLRVAQTTPLGRYGVDSLQLAPCRLLTLLDRGYTYDPLELFSFVVHECGFQPATLCLNLSRSKSWTQCLQESEKFSNVLSHFLHKTVVLELNSVHQDVAPVLRGVLEAVSRNIGSSRLRYLCWPSMTTDAVEYLSPCLFTLPSNPAHACYQGLDMLDLGIVYQDAFPHLTALFEHQSTLKYVRLSINIHDHQRIQASAVNLFSALSSLSSQPHFKILWLQVTCCLTTCKSLLRQLLWQFMAALCTQTTELRLWVYEDYAACNCTSEVAENVPIPSSLGAIMAVPNCGLEHKTLITNMMELVLELLKVRLKSITFDCRSVDCPHLHQCAIHPDLQVATLTLQFDDRVYSSTFLATLQEDLIAFFIKPTLREVSISGSWVKCEEIRCALVLALHRRAQVGPLQEISFSDCDYDNDPFTLPHMPGYSGQHANLVYDDEKTKEIWDAIFSLPKLDEMELVVAGSLCEWVLQHERLFYESWEQFGSRQRIEQLEFVPDSIVERIPDALSNLAQTSILHKVVSRSPSF